MASSESSQTNWQISKNSLKERNKHMFNNTLISDVNFSVKDSNTDRQQSLIIPTHKYILAISSPVFFAMFYGQTPDTSDTIELSDCDSDSFVELLRFLYCDKVKLTGTNVIQVMYLAKKYMIPSLSEECTKFLRKNLDAPNVFSVLPGAQLYEEVSLVHKCWEVVDETSEEAMSSEAFLDVSHDLLKAVLKRDSLYISEVNIFKAVDRWVEHQCQKTEREFTGEEKRRILGDAINLIRFPLMTQEEFAATVPDTNLLPKEDMCDIFLYFNNATKTPLLFPDVPRKRPKEIIRIQRFESAYGPGIGWNYGGQTESVAFYTNKNVSVCGVRLFGSDGNTYSVIIGIYVQATGLKLTEEVGRFDTDKNIANGYYGFDVIFKTPAAIRKNELYEITAVINGPKSYCGDKGRKQCKKTQREVTGEEKRRILGDAINLIRFPLMTQVEFAEVVPKTRLLTKESMCDILLHFDGAKESPLKFSEVARLGSRTKIIKRVTRFKDYTINCWGYGGSTDSLAFSVNCNLSVSGVRLFGSLGGAYSVTIGIYSQPTGAQLTEEVGRFNTDKYTGRNGYYGFDVLLKKTCCC